MRPITVTQSSAGQTQAIPMDTHQVPFNIGIAVVLSAGSSLTYSVEHTFDDVFAQGYNSATGTWFQNTGLTAQTASANGNYAFPVRAVRLNVTSYTSGNATLNVVQAGVMGG